MPGGGIIIISGGGGARVAMQPSIRYTLLAGEGVQNTATSGPAVHVIFRAGASAADWYLDSGPGAIQAAMVDGTVELA